MDFYWVFVFLVFFPLPEKQSPTDILKKKNTNNNKPQGKHPTEEHFGAVAENLVATLKELNVPQQEIDDVVAVVLTTKDDVLGKEEVPEKSLYDRIGGAPAVDAAVDIFYKKVLADKRIAYMFKDTDMKRQHAHQKKFLTYAFGGPNEYEGKDMRCAHAGVNGGIKIWYYAD